MAWWQWYLVIGIFNAITFGPRNFSSVIEVAFFVLLWPLQLLFKILMGIHWLIEKIPVP